MFRAYSFFMVNEFHTFDDVVVDLQEVAIHILHVAVSHEGVG